MVSVSLDNDLITRLDRAIETKGLKRSAVVAAAVEHWLKHQEEAPTVETMISNPDREN